MPQSWPIRSILLLTFIGIGLAACSDEKDQGTNLASLDAPLTTNASDPAMREALEAPLASDPDMASEANRDAVRPADKPLNGALPVISPVQAREQALRLAGGKLLPTPAATESIISTRDTPVTLGGMIRQQQEKNGASKGCGSERISYAMTWADRLPAALPLYPGANVMEAAGVTTTGPCAFRAVGFRTGSAIQDVMDFYTTMAKRGGYSLNHSEQNDSHVLTGGKGTTGIAYYIKLRKAGDGTAVDLITNGGT